MIANWNYIRFVFVVMKFSSIQFQKLHFLFLEIDYT